MPAAVVVFDAYGTLFDVAAAAREAAAEPGGEALAAAWPAVAELWRRRQIEYAWIRSLAGEHNDFWRVTCEALSYALAALGIDDARLEARLREIYLRLPAYPDAKPALSALRARGARAAILSNGSPEMLSGAIESAGLGALLDEAISVEAVGVYKPHPSTYALVGERFRCRPQEVLFVSSNGWDAAGATAFGFRAAWVNRLGGPEEWLPWRPAHVVGDLAAVPDLLAGP